MIITPSHHNYWTNLAVTLNGDRLYPGYFTFWKNSWFLRDLRKIKTLISAGHLTSILYSINSATDLESTMLLYRLLLVHHPYSA